eukprot:2574547-Karenia_brevis.AAC.1
MPSPELCPWYFDLVMRLLLIPLSIQQWSKRAAPGGAKPPERLYLATLGRQRTRKLMPPCHASKVA